MSLRGTPEFGCFPVLWSPFVDFRLMPGIANRVMHICQVQRGSNPVHRITFATIVAVLSSSGFAFAPSPVHADCAADIETIEEQLDSGGGSRRSEGKVQAASNIVKKAKAALAEGKKKKCENLIKKARDRLGNS